MKEIVWPSSLGRMARCERHAMEWRFRKRKPEIRHVGQWVGDAVHAASMRPRFMNRGSLPSPRCVICPKPICFNEAPIHESGKYADEESGHSGDRALQ